MPQNTGRVFRFMQNIHTVVACESSTTRNKRATNTTTRDVLKTMVQIMQQLVIDAPLDASHRNSTKEKTRRECTEQQAKYIFHQTATLNSRANIMLYALPERRKTCMGEFIYPFPCRKEGFTAMQSMYAMLSDASRRLLRSPAKESNLTLVKKKVTKHQSPPSQ